MDMVDYVVVHELSHLRHMDHSPQFWDVVASILPDHAQRRRALNEATPRSA
jgi:predicted metal-dependent hydrolase